MIVFPLFLIMLTSTRMIATAFTTNCAASVQSARARQSPHPHVTLNNGKRGITQLFSSSSTKLHIEGKIRYIAGRRALILHPPPSNAPPVPYPPLVILGGTAQSISSWTFHLQQLCSVRTVMVYEALGQGPPPPSEVCSIDGKEVTLEQYYRDVTLKRQAQDFWDVVEEAFFDPDSYYYQNCDASISLRRQVDVAGFSFGGRVAMAAATIQPKRIRRLHLTGVGAERDEYANIILTSWREILGADLTIDGGSTKNANGQTETEGECNPDLYSSRCTSRLRAFAWSIILSTYSEKFLASAGSKRVQTWVDGVCEYNTEEGLKALLMQTHGLVTNDDNKQSIEPSEMNQQSDLWTPAAMAQRIKSGQCLESCKVLVGSKDKIAAPTQAMMLAQLLGLLDNDSAKSEKQSETANGYYRVIDVCGHAVPMEAHRIWRDDLTAFLTE